MSSPRASVVILTYSHPQNVVNIIEALKGQDCEIIIADDGLGFFDPASYDAPVKVYTHRRTVPRRATTRNGGASLATTDNLIFLDDDSLPSPWLVGAHCDALVDMDASVGTLTLTEWDINFDMRFKRYGYRTPPNRDLHDMFWTGNIAIKRSVFEECGGFDTRYDGEYGFEDSDLAAELQHRFKRMYWNPEAVARNLDPSGQWGHSEGEANTRKYNAKWHGSPRSYTNERVLLVTPGFAYASLEWAEGFGRALYHRGFEVRKFDLNLLMTTLDGKFRHDVKDRKASIIKLASEQLGPAILRTQPDWVLVVEGTRIHKAAWEVLKLLQGVRVGLVLTESPYSDEEQQKFAPYADVVFCNERDSVELYDNCFYLPSSFDRFVHRPRRVVQDFGSDVLLAMGGTKARHEYIAVMDWDHLDTRLIGYWPEITYGNRLYANLQANALPNAILARWYNGAAVGFNLYREGGGSSLNPRAYEMAACGCFQLSSKRGENDLFGDSIVVGKHPYDAERKIRYYVKHEAERREKAEEAMERVRNCSFDDRVEIIIRGMRGGD